MTQEEILTFLSSYAYQPTIVYLAILAILTASSFGLPMPEEVTLISAGVLGHLALDPQKFPPPYPGARAVDPWSLALVCFLSVFISDLLVYCIGRYGGDRLRKSKRLAKYAQSGAFLKVESMTKEHGAWMSGVFRFTPGLRFPGHLTCGMMGVAPWKFCLIDGTAALLTVPTQVLLVSYYGEAILGAFKQFKIVLFGVMAVAILIYVVRKSPTVRRWIGLGAP